MAFNCCSIWDNSPISDWLYSPAPASDINYLFLRVFFFFNRFFLFGDVPSKSTFIYGASILLAFMLIPSGVFCLSGFLELESPIIFLFLTTEVSNGGNLPSLFLSSFDQDDQTTEELH